MNFAPDDLNDSLSDLIANVDVEKAANPVAPPANYIPGTGRPNKFKDATLYTETCRKCRGTGRYNAPSTHGSRCFECDGVGSKTFKTSPEHRAKAKGQKNARKAAKAAEIAAVTQQAAEAFRAANPAICAWVDSRATSFGFAASMQSAIAQWGGLTVGQMDAVNRLIAKDAERATEAAARAAAAPVADQAGVDRLKLAFDTAISKARERGMGFKNPKITIGGMTISPAKATSSNPGALYVKNGGEYLGKVQDGRFRRVQACTDAQEKQVLAFIADPKAAATAYGIETGVCCVCNATLTSKWRLLGIGPICSTKMGW
jgi:hypothetical protein